VGTAGKHSLYYLPRAQQIDLLGLLQPLLPEQATSSVPLLSLMLFGSTGVWTPVFELARLEFKHLSQPIWLFRDGILLFVHTDLDCDPPVLCFLPSLGCQACTTMSRFFPLKWCLTNVFWLGWPGATIVSILPSHVAWDDRHMPLCPATDWIESRKLFSLGWPCTAILLIPASQVARITSVSQWHLANLLSFFKLRNS
jgi:hypothetical protein